VSYRVFARKYRPQRFEEVVGQEHITQTLQNAIKGNRLAQAYLFVGPRGVGKTSTARILAKALNCQNGPTDNPCGVCDACVEIAEGRSLDVLEIDGASNNSVESIRTLRENAAYAPARGPYKVYLIDEVHMLTTAAFNALLKTLEEPPEHVKFLFATTEAQKVPATILSRCQRFDLRRLTPELIANHLLFIAKSEEITLEPAASDAIARGADGALRDAESMLDQVVAFCGTTITAADVHQVFGFTPRETLLQLAQALLGRDTTTALALVKAQSEAGKDLSRLLADLIGLLRDILISKVHPPQGSRPSPLDKRQEASTRCRPHQSGSSSGGGQPQRSLGDAHGAQGWNSVADSRRARGFQTHRANSAGHSIRNRGGSGSSSTDHSQDCYSASERALPHRSS
jgi:DNA polymerase-3 subunit gamma/tau